MPGNPAIQNVSEESQPIDEGGPDVGAGVWEKVNLDEHRNQHQSEGGEKIGNVRGGPPPFIGGRSLVVRSDSEGPWGCAG